MKVLIIIVALLLTGCAVLPERSCSARDKELLQYWYALKSYDAPVAAKQAADRFLQAAIEADVPLHCWRNR